MKLAPETLPKDEKAELKFQKKTEDTVKEAAKSWISILRMKQDSILDAEVFFTADVGESRQSHIEAECYDPDSANCSKYVWKTGKDGFSIDYIQQIMRANEFSTDTSGYKEQFREILNQYEKAVEEPSFSREEGQKQAEKVMKDLGVSGMTLFSDDARLWFSEEDMPDDRYGQSEDFFWQADLEKAKVGYKYVFTRAFGDVSVDQSIGAAMKQTADTYTAPFSVETVSIMVTDDGVKTFSWEGMCDEVSTIAENVKLLPFEDVQKQLFEQIYYYYLGHGQPSEDTTNFIYKVTSAKLGYTYVTAFKNPKNAWLVPTWFFEVMEGSV